MFELLEVNSKFKNVKHELIELFPKISRYAIDSIYTETLRGQIKKIDRPLNRAVENFRWKKLSSKSIKETIKYKKYIINIANLLENICPEELNETNIEKYTYEMAKAVALLCRRRGYILDESHALLLLVTWNSVGRFRTLEKKYLVEELKKYTNVEQLDVDSTFNDLCLSGLLINIGKEYGIHSQLIL